jgi:uncharacterized protein (DUF2384 family)
MSKVTSGTVENGRMTLEQVFRHALDVFETPELTAKWLTTPNLYLGCSPLLALLQGRIEEIDQQLGRIEWGVY